MNSSPPAMVEPQKVVIDVIDNNNNNGKTMSDFITDATITCNTTITTTTTHQSFPPTTTTTAPSNISYWQLIMGYPMYRYFLISYIVTQLGEWLTYVASLSILELASLSSVNSIDDVIVEESLSTISPAVQEISKHHYIISILVVCRLLPTTISSFFGGILADTCDRKIIMFRLDICGGCVAMIYYILSIQTLNSSSNTSSSDGIDNDRSFLLSSSSSSTTSSTTSVSTVTVVILLLCTIAQSTISGLYQPSRSSIVPMLVGEDKRDNIERANEISSILWSLMAAFGSSLGGFIVDHYGVAICFMTDAVMYFTSALVLIMFVNGNYNVLLTSAVVKSSTSNVNSTRSIPSTTDDVKNIQNDKFDTKKSTTTVKSSEQKTSTRKYIGHGDSGSKSHGGMYGLLRDVRLFILTNDSAPYLLIKGCGAILFGASDVINVTYAQDPVTGVLDPQRLGYLFSAIGIGCLLGPISMPPRRCYLSACIASYYVIGLGYGCMAWSQNFWWKCFWTMVRSSGTSVLWVDSTILLQTTIPATLLGRITSIDFAIALLGEAVSAMFAGLGQDYGLSAQQVSFVLSGLGMFWGVLWTVATAYHRHQKHNKSSRKDLSLVELEPLTLNP